MRIVDGIADLVRTACQAPLSPSLSSLFQMPVDRRDHVRDGVLIAAVYTAVVITLISCDAQIIIR